MKEIKLYQCGICHTRYSVKTACENCEKNHKTELKIVDGIFRALKDDMSGYPIRIHVQDSKTEKIVEYVRGKVL